MSVTSPVPFSKERNHGMSLFKNALEQASLQIAALDRSILRDRAGNSLCILHQARNEEFNLQFVRKIMDKICAYCKTLSLLNALIIH